MTLPYTLKRVHDTRPIGHAFFECTTGRHAGRLVLADSSGGMPETTDDGPLWIDATTLQRDGRIVLRIWRDGGSLVARIPVLSSPDADPESARHAMITSTDAIFLGKALGGLPVIVEDKGNRFDLAAPGAQTLDRIAAILRSTPDWNADTLDDIALVIEASGRSVNQT